MCVNVHVCVVTKDLVFLYPTPSHPCILSYSCILTTLPSTIQEQDPTNLYLSNLPEDYDEKVSIRNSTYSIKYSMV